VVQDAQVQGSAQLVPQAPQVSFIPRDSGRPYSQLAGYMSCSDWSPNVWNGYASERAARVAIISQHVDMQCSCFECKKNCLHTHASACGSDGCSGGDCKSGVCKAKVGTKITNRYRQSISTLHAAPCESCGPSCGSICSAQSNHGVRATCNTIPSGFSSLYPTAQTQPEVGLQSTSPLIANPVINNPRSAMNEQDLQLKIGPRR